VSKIQLFKQQLQADQAELARLTANDEETRSTADISRAKQLHTLLAYLEHGHFGQYTHCSSSISSTTIEMRKQILSLFPLIDTFFPYEFKEDDLESEPTSLPAVPAYTVSSSLHPSLRTIPLTLRTRSSALSNIKMPVTPAQYDTDNVTTYILQLEHGCFYVGITKDFTYRLQQHRGEKQGGAQWTIEHKPTGICGLFSRQL